jgi:dTDP-4-dehydrorhamnose reductase
MRNIKVLVTGSSGMLGSEFLHLMQESHSTSSLPAGINIADNSAVAKALSDTRPNIVIHTAAYTDVDGCELDPNKAHQVNVLGTKNIANYCSSNNVKMVFISSTGIYGDSKEANYSEDDRPDPQTVHHASKLEAEHLVASLVADHLILRVGWLYGGSISQKNNFVYKRFLEAKNTSVIYASSSQKGNPTSCQDVVRQTCLLINKCQTGVFNCVNGAVDVTRFDYVKEIIEQLGLDCRVELAPPDMFKRLAPVSSNESAVNKKLGFIGLDIMPSWKVALARYICELKFDFKFPHH